ncbi:MAG TPA: hemerythrin domain-containing protein [Bryobacteraceae bacterium]|nr:hemerythrin domain-containing protein [Bryobacteraceae bacterium]
MLRDRALVPLSQQHHNGLALCVLTDRSLEGEPSEEAVARLTTRALDRYDLEISNHFAIEEEIVFPAIERELGPQPILAGLVADHRQLERLVDQLRLAPDREILKQFSALLRAHIRREETEFFAEMQQRIPRKVLDALGAEIDTRAVRMPI